MFVNKYNLYLMLVWKWSRFWILILNIVRLNGKYTYLYIFFINRCIHIFD